MPRQVVIGDPVPEEDVYCAVLDSINTGTFNVYKNGSAFHGAGRNAKEKQSAMIRTARRSIYQAIARVARPIPYSDHKPLYCVLNVWIKDIALSPPDHINSNYLVCEDTTQLGVNITPRGTFVDLHYDIGRSGFSMVYGRCEKVLVLFPPTQKNLEIFAQTAGLSNRLARIGDKLEGGLIVRITSSLAIDLPSCALHAVFTTAGGFLGGINFSTVEELPIMAQAISAQLSISFAHDADAIFQDIKVYLSALKSTLRLKPPHKVLVPVIESWLDLKLAMASIEPLPPNWLKEEAFISAALNDLRRIGCNCGAKGDKETHHIDDHFKGGECS
ncbi:hypothetical protein ACLOAV_008307 [Pseudogymnoascus australis]